LTGKKGLFRNIIKAYH